jgi:hypothetical protein
VADQAEGNMISTKSLLAAAVARAAAIKPTVWDVATGQQIGPAMVGVAVAILIWVAMTPPRPLRPMSRIAGAIMI